MRLWKCSVSQGENKENIYSGISAKHEWQAQLIAFIMDGGLGEEPSEETLDYCVNLAKVYTRAEDMNPQSV